MYLGRWQPFLHSFPFSPFCSDWELHIYLSHCGSKWPNVFNTHWVHLRFHFLYLFKHNNFMFTGCIDDRRAQIGNFSSYRIKVITDWKWYIFQKLYVLALIYISTSDSCSSFTSGLETIPSARTQAYKTSANFADLKLTGMRSLKILKIQLKRAVLFNHVRWIISMNMFLIPLCNAFVQHL